MMNRTEIWLATRWAFYVILFFLLMLWIKGSQALAWVITLMLATLAGVPPGPMNDAQAKQWATVDAVIAVVFIGFGFYFVQLAYRWITKVTEEKMKGEEPKPIVPSKRWASMMRSFGRILHWLLNHQPPPKK